MSFPETTDEMIKFVEDMTETQYGLLLGMMIARSIDKLGAGEARRALVAIIDELEPHAPSRAS